MPTAPTALDLDLVAACACTGGGVAAVMDLLTRGADPDAADGHKKALLNAVDSGDLAVAFALLKAGANPNTRSALGFTPVMFAADRGDANMIELLHRFGADVNATSLSDGYTALAIAAKRADIVTFAKLAELGADASAAVSGWTPYQFAVWARTR